MKFGFFDDQAREYVITDPATPYPWINYLGMEDFYSIMSNTAGGYSFYRDARLRRITRYRYNNVPLDMGGKYFYIRETDGRIWSPGWKPSRTPLDRYECRHGLGYTCITGELDQLQAAALYFVPLGFNGEIQHLHLENSSEKPRRIKLYSMVEFCLWNALDDMTNFQRNFSTGEVEISDRAVYHKTEYRERRNHYAFYAVNKKFDGFETDLDAFLGAYNGFEAPKAVVNGSVGNSVAHGWSPVGVHYFEIELQPGEQEDLVFILGYAENPEEEKWESPGIINKAPALSMQEQFQTTDQVNAALAELKKAWNELLGKYQVESPESRLDRMVNIWNQYQCMVTFNMSRSASYFESGIGRGMGFRDSNQDLIGFVHQIPARARQRILDLAATQFEDGGAYHQYQPLTKRGNSDIGSNFNDDPLWLILSVSAYIKETGDWKFLEEKVPFDNDETCKASLFEHLHRSFMHVVENRGPHGLPLIGRADWNDCLNLNCFSQNPDEPFQTTENKSGGTAESVMIAGMFVLYGNEFAEICQRTGKFDLAAKVRSQAADMKAVIDEHGWDGEWFIRAYDYFGEKVGSRENDEGKIFIESQGFGVMAGIGLDDGRALHALESVKKYLACDQGIVLNHPAYTKYYLNLGEISTYPQGYKENAGVFCHNNPWIIIGETMLGRGKEAMSYYQRIAPSFREDESELYKTEPYVYAQMVAGKDAHKPGEAKNSWLTGTAAWNFYAVSQYILGIRPEYDGLTVDPCIPPEWKEFTVRRLFRGAEYVIRVVNPSGFSKGVRSLTVDGNEIKTGKLPVFGDGKIHQVTAELG